MMTPQDVASATFPKAALGGYNMASVDVFLDKLTDDYNTLYQENAALKAKMKVLVDKMEEYHAMEDTMRSTLLTAQKMANSMIAEAEEKRASLLADAEADARVRMRELAADVAAEERRLEAVHADIDRQIAAEQGRLVMAKRELVTFINAARKLCDKQIEFIERLPVMEILPEGEKLEEEAPAPRQENAAAAEVETNTAEPCAEPETPAPAETPAEEPAAAAMAEMVEELGGDAGSLMKNMQNVIDSFVADGEVPPKAEGNPFEDDFDDAGKLFEDDTPVEAEKTEERKDDDRYDNFTDEDEDATRVIKLDELQFGRNYNKD